MQTLSIPKKENPVSSAQIPNTPPIIAKNLSSKGSEAQKQRPDEFL